MYASLAVIAATSNPFVYFIVVAVLIAVALFYIPTILPMDAKVWQLIRIVVIIALLLWALRLFGVL